MSLSEEINEQDHYRCLVHQKIVQGEDLIESTQFYSDLEGIQKLQRKIAQELKFLRKISKSHIKKEHLQCSNLSHFAALLSTLKTLQDIQSVSKVFLLQGRKITIDVICDGGLTWVKVIARNAKSIEQVCNGDSSFGVRSVLDQAEDYLGCAKENPCCFRTPKVVFVFTQGVGGLVAKQLLNLGVDVVGLESAYLEQQKTQIDRVNLDVSAMLAYVSSVTNGSAALYDFSVKVLSQQADWERQRPQKPLLESFFAGKSLYCCQTAYDSFVEIVNTVGGVEEKKRALDFLQSVTVLPDNATSSDLDEAKGDLIEHAQLTNEVLLKAEGKIRHRSLVIFTFGDRIGAVTVTANDGFIRAARQKGVNFVVFVHESRALTEQKELLKGTNITRNQ